MGLFIQRLNNNSTGAAARRGGAARRSGGQGEAPRTTRPRRAKRGASAPLINYEKHSLFASFSRAEKEEYHLRRLPNTMPNKIRPMNQISTSIVQRYKKKPSNRCSSGKKSLFFDSECKKITQDSIKTTFSVSLKRYN